MSSNGENHNPNGYFFETIGRDQNANVSVLHELESLKNIVSGQRKNNRNRCTQSALLNSIQSPNLEALFQGNIDNELKKVKEGSKQIKQQTSHKKDEKRKLHKKFDKLMIEIFKRQQEIETRRADLDRLSKESNLLQNKHQKQLNDVNHNRSYNISDLIDPFSCQNILAQQDEISQRHNEDIHQQKDMLSTQKSANKQLNYDSNSLDKTYETYESLLSIQQSENMNIQQNDHKINTLKQELQSLQRLFGFKRVEVHANEFLVEFESVSNELYLIQIATKRMDTESVAFLIESIQIMNNNTRFNEISESILSKYNASKNEVGEMATIKSTVTEIVLLLKKLALRYRDIHKLYDIYGSNEKQNMLPWLPENGQLVFKFSFKQTVRLQSGDNDDDDNKMDADQRTVDILMDIPLVISMLWEYPQSIFINKDNVITIEHYNCSLRDKQHGVNVAGIEAKWNQMLQKTVTEMNGRFQNDIVSFVNFVHDQLQRFADSNQ